MSGFHFPLSLHTTSHLPPCWYPHISCSMSTFLFSNHYGRRLEDLQTHTNMDFSIVLVHTFTASLFLVQLCLHNTILSVVSPVGPSTIGCILHKSTSDYSSSANCSASHVELQTSHGILTDCESKWRTSFRKCYCMPVKLPLRSVYFSTVMCVHVQSLSCAGHRPC